MREAASRGFWVTTYAPYGYRKVYVQDGVKKRPKLELNPPADAVVRRIFDMVLQGRSILDVTKTLNAEGIPTTNGKKWLNPNPPKDTDGRREDSGRGWVRELQGRWPGVLG